MRPQTYASLAVEVSKHLSDGPLGNPKATTGRSPKVVGLVGHSAKRSRG
jgi:hypothetical protein